MRARIQGLPAQAYDDDRPEGFPSIGHFRALYGKTYAELRDGVQLPLFPPPRFRPAPPAAVLRELAATGSAAELAVRLQADPVDVQSTLHVLEASGQVYQSGTAKRTRWGRTPEEATARAKLLALKRPR